MNFGEALECLKDGEGICRLGWNGKGMFVKLQVPNELSKMTEPYTYIVNGNRLNPWVPSVSDMLSDDWEIAAYADRAELNRILGNIAENEHGQNK